MLYYATIEVSQEIDVNKTDGSQKCIICHYWYFLNINVRFQPEARNDCHELMQKAMSFNDVAIVNVKRNDYRIHFFYMSKDEVRNLLRNPDLTEKKNDYYKTEKFILSHLKMDKKL